MGRAIAIRLAKDGHDVAVNAQVPAEMGQAEEVAADILTYGRRSFALGSDVTNPKQVDEMIAGVEREWGKLDVCIANAEAVAIKPLIACTHPDIESMLKANVYSAFYTYIAAARQMMKQGHGGKIIGESSIAAYKPFSHFGTWSASKWAVRGLTQAAAAEWGPEGISVNSYAPGVVGKAMWNLMDQAMGESNYAKWVGLSEENRKDINALRKVSEEEDVAKVVSFLASPDANHVTGQTIIVDGGIEFS